MEAILPATLELSKNKNKIMNLFAQYKKYDTI